MTAGSGEAFAGGTNYVWDGGAGNGNWNTANNWNNNTLPTFDNQANLQFAGTVQVSTTNTLSGTTTLRSIVFNSGAGAFTLSGNAVSLANAAGIKNSSSNTQTISLASIDLGAATMSFDATTGELIINSSLVGTNGFDVTGTRVTLTGSSSFSGASTVTSGTLRITNSFALGGTAAGLTVQAAAALELANNISVGAEPLTISGLGTSNLGALRNISGTNSFGGPIALGAGARINSQAGLLTLSGTIGGAQNLTFGGAGDITVSNTIGIGAGNLTYDGSGLLTLSGNNTYSGTTTISSGTVSASSIVAAPSASNLGNATSAVVLGDGSNQGTLLYTGNSATYTRGFTLNAGGGQVIVNTSGQTLTIGTGNVTGASGGDLTIAGPGNTTVSSTLAMGTGGLIKQGGGTLTLSSSNSFTGNTTLSSGTLVLGNSGALFNSTLDVGTGAAGTLSFGSLTAATFGGLTGGNNLALSNTGGSAVALTIGGNNVSGTYSGVLSGSGSLTKTGATGAITLSGNNTYTGTTAILSGTLSTGSVVVSAGASGLGNASSAVTLGDGTNEGTLSYTGNSATYTRGFAVGAGGGQLLVTTAGQTLTIGTGTVTSTSGTFTLGGAGNASVSSGLSLGTGGLIKEGSGTATLSTANTYSGSTTITAGVLRATSSASALGSGGLNMNGGNLELANDSGLNFGRNTTVAASGTIFSERLTAGTGVTHTLGTLSIGAQTLTADTDATVTGGTAGLTFGNVTLTGAATLAANAGTLLTTGTITGNNALTIGGAGNTTIAGFSPATATQTLTKSGAGTLTLAGTSGYTGLTTISGGTLAYGIANALSTGGITIQNGATLDIASFNDSVGTVTLTSGNIVGTSGTLTSTANFATTSGTISAILAGGVGVAQAASGTTVLTAANTFSGASTIAAGGVLNIRNATALGTTAAGVTITSGGALELQGDITVGAEALSLAGTGISSSGALRNISGTNTYGGLLTLTAATEIQSDAGLLTLSNAGTITGATFGLTVDGAGDTSIASIIGTTSGVLTKNGTGRLTLTGANTYTGATSITAGVLNVQNATGLGTTAGGVTVSSGAALEVQGGITVGAEALSLAGTGISSGGALRNISGNNTYGGALTGTAATRINSDAGQLTLSNTISGAFPFTFGGAGNTVVSGTIATGANGLTKDGTGLLTLSAQNTYTGATTISAGTVSASSIVVSSSASNLGNATSAVVLGDGSNQGTLSYTGNSATYTRGFTVNAGGGRLDVTTLGQTLTATTGNITGTGLFTVGGAGNVTISSTISGISGLTMAGSGTLRLNAANTYGGTTTVNSGVLVLGANNVLSGSNAVNVTGGTLDNGGSTNSVASFSISGGSYTGSGTLTAGTYSLQGGTISANLGSGTIATQASTTLSGTSAATAVQINTGTLTLSSANILSASPTITGSVNAALSLGGSQTIGSLAGAADVALGSNTLTTGGNNSSTSHSGGFTGAGNLRKVGSGTFTLSGNSAFSGTTSIDSGAVSVGSVASGSTNQPLGTGNTVNLGVASTSSGRLVYTGGSGTMSKNINSLGNGSDTVQNQGTGLLTLSGTLKKDNTVLRLQGGAQGITVTGQITGTSSNSDLAVQNGLTTLSATNSYVGPTYINSSGTLALGITNAIPSNSAVTIGGTFAGGDGGVGTLALGSFTNQIGGLAFSGSGGTISFSPTLSQTSTLMLTASGTVNLNGTSTLDLNNTVLTAGLYRLISGGTVSGVFSGTSGLDSNYFVRYGTVNANEVDLQRKANQNTTFTMTPANTRALVSTTVTLSGSLSNSTPTGGSNLAVSLSSGGGLTVNGFSSGTTSTAPQASTSVAGSILTGTTAGTLGWSVVNTDANAIQTTSTATGSLTVVNDRTYTSSTIAFGRFLKTTNPLSGTSTITSLGLSATTASGTINGFGGSNGLTLSLAAGSTNAFLGSGTNPTQTATYTTSGSYTGSLGNVSSSFTGTATNEFGTTSSVNVAYTANPVDQRQFSVTNGTVALGRYLITSTLPTGTTGVTSSGSNATTANATLGAFSSSNGYTLSLTSGSATFNGASASQTAGYTVSGTASSSGLLSGSFSSSVTAEFGSISPVVVNYTANPVDQRQFTVDTPSISLGRFLKSGSAAGSTSISSTGAFASTESGTIGSFANVSGLTLSLTSGSAQFNGAATQTAGYTLGGIYSGASGAISGTFSTTASREFSSAQALGVAFTGNALDVRTITAGTATDLGTLHVGGAVSVTSAAFTTAGSANSTTSVRVAAGSGTADANGISLSGAATDFTGSTSSATRSFGGTVSKLGAISGTFTLAVSTLENSGAGLAGEGPYASVPVAYTANVFSGTAAWAGNGGAWGSNASWAGVGGANAAPGTFAGFTNTDAAIFGTAASRDAQVTIAQGVNPSLKSLTFDNGSHSYTLGTPGAGPQGSLTFIGSGTSAATLSVLSGSHTIHAPIGLGSDLAVSIASGGSLLLHTAVTGSAFGLTVSGAGVLTMHEASTFGGGTTIDGGNVVLQSTTGLGSGAITLLNGGTLDLNFLNVANTIQIYNGTVLHAIANAPKQVLGEATFGSGASTGGTVDIESNGKAIFKNEFKGNGSVKAGAVATFDSTVSGSVSVTGTGVFNSVVSGSAGVTINAGGVVKIADNASIAAAASLRNDGQLVFDRSSGKDLTVAASIVGEGLIKKLGAGVLTLSGSSSAGGGVDVQAGGLILNTTLSGSTANIVLAADTFLGGSGRTEGTVSGAGLWAPGNSPGISEATSVDPSAGLDFAFEFTGTGAPDWGTPTASINDVARLTSLSDPFASVLTAGNVVDIYFNVTSVNAYDSFLGGFFTDKSEDFTSKIANATFRYFVKTTGTGSVSYNGTNYVSLSTDVLPTFTTVQVSAQKVSSAAFQSGTVTDGYATRFVIIPEPSAALLGGLGVTALLGRSFLRRRSILRRFLRSAACSRTTLP